MPYVKDETRNYLKTHKAIFPGELAFKLAQVIQEYKEKDIECYAMHNEIVGALECLKLEYARRFLYPYEDKKREENGDVW